MRYKLQAQTMKPTKYGDQPFNKITHEFEGSCLKDMLENLESWLRGIGYHFDGHLDIVYQDEGQRDSGED